MTLRRLHPQPAVHEPAVRGLGFRTHAGGCVFLRSDHLCQVHADLGVQAKPATCRRYPFNLVATPEGLRVVTPHRCPCRTMGARPALTPAQVAEEILIDGAALEVDHQVGGQVRLARDERVPFAAWAICEARLQQRLLEEPPTSVLSAQPFPPLRDGSWQLIARQLRQRRDDSSFDVAKAWAADAIAFIVEGTAWPERARPWTRFFVAAERRTVHIQSQQEMIADWLADELWSLQWTQFGSFARGRQDLATRTALVFALAERIVQDGVRHDRATAEALMIVDVVTHSSHWYDVVRAFREV